MIGLAVPGQLFLHPVVVGWPEKETDRLQYRIEEKKRCRKLHHLKIHHRRADRKRGEFQKEGHFIGPRIAKSELCGDIVPLAQVDDVDVQLAA